MRNISPICFPTLLFCLKTLALPAQNQTPPSQPPRFQNTEDRTLLAAKTPVDYVNPFIGTGGHGHTFPGATVPFGFVQLSPDTRTEGWDAAGGYHFSDSTILGFSHTHLSGTGVNDYCDLLFMPFTGRPELEKKGYASPFKKSREHAEAGFYSVFLEKDKILAELTATERVGIHRYTFPKNRENAHLLLDLRHRDHVLDAFLRVVNEREIEGFRVSKDWANEQHLYFVARFSKPISGKKILDMSGDQKITSPEHRGQSIVGVFDFQNTDNQQLVIEVGISAVSMAGARANLDAEAPKDFDFDKTRESAREKWAKALNRVEVSGGTETQKTAFYTALYHTMVVPNIFNDVNGLYRGRDGKTHQADDHSVYSVFSLWDTYRACNPLYTILEPARANDFIVSFLLQYEQSGLLPIWELSACETDCMIGNHSIPVIYDAWQKGFRGFDGKLALEAMLKSANQDRYGLKFYKQLGYVPSEKEPESVSKTLEYAYDDWCIAQMARSLGDEENYQTFIRRAQNYKNVFDPASGFFRAKNNSAWHQPFDPFEVNFNYTEANAWQYRFAAPQDIDGMMQLHGGRENFARQLDELFSAEAKTSGRDQADITGLIGQYVHGNEPSHHMAYLYNYAGQPSKTQLRVRQIMDEMYSDQPDGLSGNEDCGQMSAWLVFSAMGFYPVVPGSGQYVLGTPWFENIRLRLPNGSTFSIAAPGVSAKNRFVKTAFFNEKPYSKAWFSHEMLWNGGVFEFEMSDKPTDWGSRPEDCPVSRIEEKSIVPVPAVSKGARIFQKKQQIQLVCLDPAAAIFYTLDGSEPTESSARYAKPFSIKKTTVLKAVAVRGGEKSPVMEAEFKMLRLDLKVSKYNTEFNSQYTGRGENGLVDGIRGGPDFRSGDWQGFSGRDVDVVLDLGKNKTVRKVSAGFLQDENSWIFYPSKMQVEVSEDGKNFRPAGEAQNAVATETKGALTQDLTVVLPAGTTARFVRVVGRSLLKCPVWHKGSGGDCWVFCDEVLVE